MPQISATRSLRFPIFFIFTIFLLFASGFADDPSSTKDSKNAVNHDSSSSTVGLRVLIIGLGLVAVVAFSVFLFKIWQKKKREEQHARLLKLFEDDDELEVELGIRD
ncbi:uncharacterized protein LOC131161636 [Malania oleifera]|uniref:uncharacterized protein LOC131161636 n=1 Tax=Malania oleifera TaxID=397392 RepID=UPI0025ADD289|nr:uncharacterized protein LOC131161636 [Malania oleifera]XP_057973529.1 uncharacterized protein LOC131161636 [Malania oleifera]XP_057973530.1 uncharacterized protein LOC131161636 [Malania oleifera]XP_057973531.1 uncharacterized protein LOC131161636 [Malania oleifera]XP_057973532.1 uncharacterized protein LOC131161636 [Malania oleifera]XP_057973533.1 uncharacterized protein LOC131161636 [Malania oleifera]XP_057973534.1 uncharacterized protein LOC131161636 [Malania oleifera]